MISEEEQKSIAANFAKAKEALKEIPRRYDEQRWKHSQEFFIQEKRRCIEDSLGKVRLVRAEITRIGCTLDAIVKAYKWAPLLLIRLGTTVCGRCRAYDETAGCAFTPPPPGGFPTIIVTNIYAGGPLRVPPATSLPAGWR
jgi:hypothetical protein